MKANWRRTIFWLSIGLNIILVRLILGMGVLVWRFDKSHKHYHPPRLEFPEGKSSITIPLEQGWGYLFAKAKVNGAEAGYYTFAQN